MNQRKMRRIPPNSKVRRRLFPEDNTDDPGRLDNFTNILQESIAREREEKSKKWNFDIINEVPLKGNYKWWYDAETDKWIGMKVEAEADKSENFLPSKFENENTPVHVRDEAAPLIRKRRRDIENKTGNKDVKRKVDFDQ